MDALPHRDPFFRKKKHFHRPQPDSTGHQRPNRHDRLRGFLQKCSEVNLAYMENPTMGATLFAQLKKEFLAERWVSHHFQSQESKELLIRLNGYFRGREGAPPIDSFSQQKKRSFRRESSRASPLGQNDSRSRKEFPSSRRPSKNTAIFFVFSLLIFLAFMFMFLVKKPVPPADLFPIHR